MQLTREELEQEILSPPTPENIERGLRSTDIHGIHLWISRTDYTPTATQVDRGMDQHMPYLLEAWMSRPDFKPTASHIHAGLAPIRETWERVMWIRCTKYTPTPEQVERGLMDSNLKVRAAWMERARGLNEDLLSLESESEDFYYGGVL